MNSKTNARLCGVFALMIALSAMPAPAQTAPATAAQLAAITDRGRRLEAYDQAAWHGSDAGLAVAGNNTAGLRYFIAMKTANGWNVDFGDLSPDGTAFLTVIEATSADGQHFAAQRFTPARSDTGFVLGAARAIVTVEATFKPVEQHHYNIAVLPNDDGTMYVYMYPAQVYANVFPLGGDERYKMSADGKTILEDHRMHTVILEGYDQGPPGTTLSAGFHTDIHSNVPEDTDIFHVLARTPSIPDYVSAGGELYRIEVDGTITDKGAVPH